MNRFRRVHVRRGRCGFTSESMADPLRGSAIAPERRRGVDRRDAESSRALQCRAAAVRLTIIDEETGVARDYSVGASVLVGALTIVVARELGYEGDAEIFGLMTLRGAAVMADKTVGAACSEAGIYSLRRGPKVVQEGSAGNQT